MKPRRIIFYLMDGISGMKIRSFNDNSNMPKTFLDELSKKSHVIKYVYGLNTTTSALYAVFSGQSHIETPKSIVPDSKLFKIKKHLCTRLKEKGYKTHYFTNNDKVLMMGASEFDVVKFSQYTPLLKDANLSDAFLGKDNLKVALFIHDLYAHDRGGLVDSKSHYYPTKEYEESILKNAINLKKNLKFLEFDPKKDLLVVFSDHGLSLDTHDILEKATFTGLIKYALNKKRLSGWTHCSKEMKSRVFFMVRHKSIKPAVDERVCTLQDCFDFVMKQIGINDYLTEKYKQYKSEDDAITLHNGAYPITLWEMFKKIIFNDRFYQFVYVKGKGHSRKKWIYQTNLHKGEYYNLKTDPLEQNPKSINFKKLPRPMQEYIEEYFCTRKISFNKGKKIK
jgi:hypothetical protein